MPGEIVHGRSDGHDVAQGGAQAGEAAEAEDEGDEVGGEGGGEDAEQPEERAEQRGEARGEGGGEEAADGGEEQEHACGEGLGPADGAVGEVEVEADGLHEDGEAEEDAHAGEVDPEGREQRGIATGTARGIGINNLIFIYCHDLIVYLF